MTVQIFDSLAQTFDNNERENGPWNARSPSNLHIGSRLRTKRMSYGICKKELCARLEIDQYHLELYEAGAKRINAKLLLRIAKALDVGPDYFFQDCAREGMRLLDRRSGSVQFAVGQAMVWEMNESNVVGGGAAGPNPGSGWHAIGTGGETGAPGVLPGGLAGGPLNNSFLTP